ncbi:MAG: ribosomal protein S18-alanine N-acetyltransferase [Allosphingosinicella sp.]|uniref:ribosomal protein S18-alanine N-acetyltransferase n=1 Tax=Allosphingosinicella sp. TaxID=2823234 RepID=UPI0039414E1D
MSEAVAIEEGGLADLPAVMTVMETAFDPCFGEAWTASQCAGLLPLPGVWLSVARIGDEAVGFALARAIAGEAELLLLAVRPDAQGRGVGKSLLNHFFRESLTRGADHLHLEVRDGNDAIKLYTRLGFSIVGRRRNYYNGRDGQQYDALSLAKTAASLQPQ